jgi:hypothetical protein
MKISNKYAILENVECKIMIMAAFKSKITSANKCNSACCSLDTGWKDTCKGSVT